jgi:hypothetical protein
MAKRLRPAENCKPRKDDGAVRAQSLIRASRERHERHQKYADWQWAQVSAAWLVLQQYDHWLPYDLLDALLREIVRVMFERTVTMRFKLFAMEAAEWFADAGWWVRSFAQDLDAFRDELATRHVATGDTTAISVVYQLVDRREAVTTWRVAKALPLITVNDFIACVEASRDPHIHVSFQYYLIPTVLFR